MINYIEENRLEKENSYLSLTCEEEIKKGKDFFLGILGEELAT